MVFFFVAGPMGFYAGGGQAGLGGPNNEAGRREAAARADNMLGNTAASFSMMAVALTFLMSGNYPILIPIVTALFHFFPHQMDDMRMWLGQRYADHFWPSVLILFAVVTFLVASDDEASYNEVRYTRARQYQHHHHHHHYQQQQQQQQQQERQQQFSNEGMPRTAVGGFEGSWGGSVFVDFAFTMVLMLVIFFLPRILVMFMTMIGRILPPRQRELWEDWTFSWTPGGPRPGSMPASRSAIASLEDIIIEERHLLMEGSPGGIMCPVCLDNMKVGEYVKRLPCKHMFHPSCVLPWLEKHNSCPTCRFELETNDPRYEAQRRRRQQQQGMDQRSVPPRNVHETRGEEEEEEETAPSSGEAGTVPNLDVGDAAIAQITRQAEIDRLMRLSIPELRRIAQLRGIRLLGAVEKREVVERIVTRRSI